VSERTLQPNPTENLPVRRRMGRDAVALECPLRSVIYGYLRLQRLRLTLSHLRACLNLPPPLFATLMRRLVTAMLFPFRVVRPRRASGSSLLNDAQDTLRGCSSLVPLLARTHFSTHTLAGTRRLSLSLSLSLSHHFFSSSHHIHTPACAGRQFHAICVFIVQRSR